VGKTNEKKKKKNEPETDRVKKNELEELRVTGR